MGMIYTLTVTFEDGVRVSEEFATQDEGILRYHRYVRDAREHDNDGVHTVQRIVLDEFDGRVIQTVYSWVRDEQAEQDEKDVDTMIAMQNYSTPWLFPPADALD
jgi:hypothetical protein